MSSGRPPKYASSDIARLLLAVAQLGSLSLACKALNFNYKAMCSRRTRNPEFAARVYTALAEHQERKASK